MRGLVDKGVLVTGGSRGIGEATARRFLEEDARVFLCGLEPDEVDRAIADLAEVGDVHGVACDVSEPDQVAEMVEQAAAWLGRIDVLVSNAGVAWKEPFLDIAPERWDRLLAINLRGAFLVGQAVARLMVEAGGGVILNMASTNGLVGEDQLAHYGASKGGIRMLTKTMAVELGGAGIRVNSVCPGYILTPLTESLDSPEFVAAYVRDRVPIGRAGRAEDVAAAFAYLASDDAGFITGTELIIDGGQIAFQ